jgi:glycosyltransferase involved in cell wall biosynthesis
MFDFFGTRAPALSVVVIFYNMQREAPRTLLSLSKAYQEKVGDFSYEVIAIDNGSSRPLSQDLVKNFGDNFQYIYYQAGTPSPCQALNYGVQRARGKLVMLCIDGARILSPGILHYSMLASRIYGKPFIYTLGMHLGNKPQNYLVDEGYFQDDEDKLLATINWENDGYSLFDISSVALSSNNGYLSRISESNCFTMFKSTFQEIGGFDENFAGAGGGLANLDFFNRVNQIEDITPVMLLGEATFHQFHGGTATNVPMKEHPFDKMAEEYLAIRGKSFESTYNPPVYFGQIHPKTQRFINPAADE